MSSSEIEHLTRESKAIFRLLVEDTASKLLADGKGVIITASKVEFVWWRNADRFRAKGILTLPLEASYIVYGIILNEAADSKASSVSLMATRMGSIY